MDAAQIKDILLFYQAAGLDYAIQEQSTNHFISPSQSRTKTQNTPQHHAQTASSLKELEQFLNDFDHSLKRTATHTCFSDGIAGSDLMIIADTPSRDDDRFGKFFSTQIGVLFDNMLASIQLDRQKVYIAHLLPWRPPGNRPPHALDIATYAPFLTRQIELAQPRLILALGPVTAQFLTGKTTGFLHLRGQWFPYTSPQGHKVDVLPTFHPATLLDTPKQKKYAWFDLLKVKQRLQEIMP